MLALPAAVFWTFRCTRIVPVCTCSGSQERSGAVCPTDSVISHGSTVGSSAVPEKSL